MEEMTRLFNLDFQLLHDVVLMAIAVFFLFMMMSKLLFNPVRKMLADRREKIAGELSDAANDKKDAAALKADYEDRRRRRMQRVSSPKRRKRLPALSRERTRKQSFPRSARWMMSNRR